MILCVTIIKITLSADQLELKYQPFNIVTIINHNLAFLFLATTAVKVHPELNGGVCVRSDCYLLLFDLDEGGVRYYVDCFQRGGWVGVWDCFLYELVVRQLNVLVVLYVLHLNYYQIITR
jgi:hypothetical protein